MSKIYPTLEEFEKDAEGILEELRRVFRKEEVARRWFYEPSIGLNNESPYDLYKKGRTEEVKDYLTRLYHGVYC